jgi:glutaredoxin
VIPLNTIKVFCLDACEHSNHLKQELWDNNIEFEEVYLGSTQAIHDLRNGGLSHARAPILQVKERFYTGNELFPGGIIDSSFIVQCLLDTGSSSAHEKNNG